MRWIVRWVGTVAMAVFCFGATEAHAAPDKRRQSTFADTGLTCPLTSPRCSDGRLVVTTRSTPAVGYNSDGSRVDAGVNQGVYTDRGLDAWGANTTFLQNGDKLNAVGWGSQRNGSVVAISDGYRVQSDPTQANSGISQSRAGVAAGEVWTSACILRTATSLPNWRMWVGSSESCAIKTLDTNGAWVVDSCSVAVPTTPFSTIYPSAIVDATTRTVDANGCWLVKASSPGRPCYGTNASGTTCGGEITTIETDGWPTSTGEVCLTATVGPSGASRVLVEGAVTSSDGGTVLFVASNDYFVLGQRGGTGEQVTASAPITAGSHRFCARRRGGVTSVLVDGVVSASSSTFPVFKWAATARLGVALGANNNLNGTMRQLTVSK